MGSLSRQAEGSGESALIRNDIVFLRLCKKDLPRPREEKRGPSLICSYFRVSMKRVTAARVFSG